MIWADRRWKLGHGGAWVELLRVDHANHFLGLRLSDWTSLLVLLGAVGYLLATRRLTREPPQDVYGEASSTPRTLPGRSPTNLTTGRSNP